MVNGKPAISLPNYSLASHSPYGWKPELMGLTSSVLMGSEDWVLPIPMCRTLTLIGTSEPVKQVVAFREVNEDLAQLGQTDHVFKEEFLARDGKMLANMRIKADVVGLRWGGIFNTAWPSPNRPPRQGDRLAVYTVILTCTRSQDEGLELPHVVLWAQRFRRGLSTKCLGLWEQRVQKNST